MRDAVHLEAEGNDAQALDTWARLLKSDPNSDEARLRAAWLQYQADQDDLAELTLSSRPSRSSAVENPASARVQDEMDGLRFLLEGKNDDAFRRFLQVSVNYPQDVGVLVYLAEVAINTDRLSDAKETLDRCMKMAPWNPFCANETPTR